MARARIAQHIYNVTSPFTGVQFSYTVDDFDTITVELNRVEYDGHVYVGGIVYKADSTGIFRPVPDTQHGGYVDSLIEYDGNDDVVPNVEQAKVISMVSSLLNNENNLYAQRIAEKRRICNNKAHDIEIEISNLIQELAAKQKELEELDREALKS